MEGRNGSAGARQIAPRVQNIRIEADNRGSSGSETVGGNIFLKIFPKIFRRFQESAFTLGTELTQKFSRFSRSHRGEDRGEQ